MKPEIELKDSFAETIISYSVFKLMHILITRSVDIAASAQRGGDRCSRPFPFLGRVTCPVHKYKLLMSIDASSTVSPGQLIGLTR